MLPHADLRQRRAVAQLVEALRKIALEPFGLADATHADVLRDVTEYARATLRSLVEEA